MHGQKKMIRNKKMVPMIIQFVRFRKLDELVVMEVMLRLFYFTITLI